VDTLLKLERVGHPAQSEPARNLITEYIDWVAGIAIERYGLVFDAAAMIGSDLSEHSPFRSPAGRLYLIALGSEYVGVGCLKKLDNSVGELQRMYVRPDFRGMGAGRLLLSRLLDDGRVMGLSALRLESLRVLHEAHALYRSAGFVEIGPYGDHSMANYQKEEETKRFEESVLFMELRF